MQTYEIPQNCPFSLPFPTVIAFHRVKKSPLIIGIVDRIKINSEQPLPFSQSELSIPYFLQIVRITYVCFVYFTAIARVCINFHRQHVWSLYSDGVKGETSPTCLRKYREEDEEAVAKRAINARSWRFSFQKHLTIFSIYFIIIIIIIIIILSFFFHTFFYPLHLPTPTPTPTTHTRDPRPLPTIHDPRHLATLVETTQKERAGEVCEADSKNSWARFYSSFTDTVYSRLAHTSLLRTPR